MHNITYILISVNMFNKCSKVSLYEVVRTAIDSFMFYMYISFLCRVVFLFSLIEFYNYIFSIIFVHYKCIPIVFFLCKSRIIVPLIN